MADLDPAAGRTPVHTKWQRTSAAWYLIGFLAIYLVAVCTPWGQRAENSLFGGEGSRPAWIHEWSGAYGTTGPVLPPLGATATPALIAGLVALVVVTLVRRCWWQGCAAIGTAVATVGATEVFSKLLLPRPDLVNAHVALTAASFPSGHVAVPAGLVLGAAFVASPRIRPFVTAAGMVWIGVTAAAVQALYHHRPSDVLGATVLACAFHLLAARLLPAAGPDSARHPRALPVAAFALSAAGALAAGARTDSAAESLVFATSAFGCGVLAWSATATGNVRRRVRAPRAS
ncbi:phosphatase PAP2 family protein [Amycolatopsis endophytica]|uniref:Phosphatidic acid phosphatase type 2/haloperoxidase domain-containing protein n=1 Tax=Amycolatopsis endophytica TaxID=860233 RepID=A0A853B174_9PSEU|nr:phosphatase PAP2 family protein [Amycolatopsis endophytica]NYI88632.1 hypothetical protein [Amycolatopsis endophytica]